MNIGKPVKRVIVEPLELPVPAVPVSLPEVEQPHPVLVPA